MNGEDMAAGLMAMVLRAKAAAIRSCDGLVADAATVEEARALMRELAANLEASADVAKPQARSAK